LARTTSAELTGEVRSVSKVPERRSSARLFIVSNGTMTQTGRKNRPKKAMAGEVSCGVPA
jgi:hypothetical protein